MPCRTAILFGVLAAWFAAGICLPAATNSAFEEARVWLTGSRAPGHPCNRALEAMVADRFRASGHTNGAILFEAPVFVPGSAALALDGGDTVPLLAMHPTLMRPGNFTAREFEAPLVYLGRGDIEDLQRVRGADLSGALALMEYDCGDRWPALLRHGLRGFVFIGADDYCYSDSQTKIYNSEVPVPRYFAPPGTGARLRSAAGAKVRVRAEPSRWENAVLTNSWVLIPGSDPQLAKEVALFTAALDANSAVPELAYGAQSVGNLQLLLRMLDDFSRSPPARSVLLVAVNGHTHKFLGERMLAWHLLGNSADLSRLRDLTAGEMRVNELYRTNYAKLKLAAPRLSPGELLPVMEMLSGLAQIVPVAPAGSDGRPGDVAEHLFRQAITAAVQRLVAERDSWRTSLATDKTTRRQIQEDIDSVSALNKLAGPDLRRLAVLAQPVFEDERLLESWRVKLDESTGQRLPVKAKLQEEINRRLNMVKARQLDLSTAPGLSADERQRAVESLIARKDLLMKVLMLFNKIDLGLGRNRTRYRQIAIDGTLRDLLKECRDNLVDKYGRWIARQREVLEMDIANDAIRDALGARRVVCVFNLELNWQAPRFGFCSLDTVSAGDWQIGFGYLSASVATQVTASLAMADCPMADTLTRLGGKPETYYFADGGSPAPFFHATGQRPAFAVKSVFASSGRSFSPDDTPGHLDPARLEGNLRWLKTFFRGLLDHPEMTAPKNLGAARAPRIAWSSVIRTFRMDEFAAKTTPDREVPGCLLALYVPSAPENLLVDGDVINCYLGLADEMGHYTGYGFREAMFAPLAYQLADDWITALHAIDKGQIQASKQMDSNIFPVPSKTLPMFPCREFIIYDRVDPTLLSDRPLTVQAFWPISAASQADPQKYGVHGVGCMPPAVSHRATGPAAVYLWRKENRARQDKLILLSENKRCALNATAEFPEGRGFEDAAQLGPDFFGAAARDMALMLGNRVARMRGVADELVEESFRQTAAASRAMERQAAEGDHVGRLQSGYFALGNMVKAYDQVQGLNADMLKAITLYMALMVPFCFFLSKLLFNLVRLEHELIAFVGLFLAVYLGFRLIHPAFAIVRSAEAILIAFILGGVGCFVIWVVHQRFEGEMSILFRSGGAMGGDVGYSTVGQTAMMIGVNNMKRRRIRTTLTTATIVLVVFTMLAFSSVSKRMQPTLVHVAPAAPYTGFFYHWPAGKTMDEASARVLGDLYADRARLVVRRAMSPPPQPDKTQGSWRLATADAGPVRAVDIDGLMGLPLADGDFLGPQPLIHGRYFSGEEAAEIIVPASVAAALRLSAEDVGSARLNFLGRDWTLVGVIDDDRYRRRRDLDPDLSLLPGRIGEDAVEESPQILGGTVSSIDTTAAVFLPAGAARRHGAMPFSVSVAMRATGGDAAGRALWNEAIRLLTIGNARFFISSPEPMRPRAESRQAIAPGVYYIGSNYRVSIGGLSRLVIPLLIAGLIIFSTMLGTVHERKSEIAVYNAVGLNPMHIFIFFLAEAMVYSVIGAIGGYLIGQILSIVIKHFHLVEGININFSSLIVVYAILMTIALVLLSTVYPAYVATRTAVPSHRRKWSLPPHDGNRLEVAFPFIYEAALAPGVMYYLHEYFASFTEQSLGDQIARDVGREVARDGEGRPLYRMTFDVALAPFDLGVTQQVRFETRYEPAMESYRLFMQATRVSGQDSNWMATNRPFLEKLRKLLIRWRNIDPARHGWYVAEGLKLYQARG